MSSSLRRNRPGAVDIFLGQLDDLDKLEELTDLANRPGVIAKHLYDLLCEWGYQGGLNPVYTWWRNNKIQGEEARKFNALLQSFVGVDHRATLDKLSVVLNQQLQQSLDAIALTDLSQKPDVALRVVPQLAKVLMDVSTFVNTQNFVKNKSELILSGAALMASEIQVIFSSSPSEVQEAIASAIKSAMTKIESTL